MKKIFSLLFLIILFNGCAINKKFEKETCQEINGLFTKAVSCLELKFLKINPKKYEKYETTHNLILEALADQIYENRINNVQAWEIYDDIMLDFNKSKNKDEFLMSVLARYN
ncbi:hypothetical protein [Candidatus Pelagibacter bacterium nBUS_25]|uniref:hypothetical protein n=1 Tax=Candidatus Pelagibacter bacterium nBUS_25 TaxID=3374187 RepID=UPI003EBC550D